MPSPFPGMDPYLERHWGDVHTRLITYASDQLQRILPRDLRARVEERVVVAGSGQVRPIFRDVRMVETRRRSRRPRQAPQFRLNRRLPFQRSPPRIRKVESRSRKKRPSSRLKRGASFLKGQRPPAALCARCAGLSPGRTPPPSEPFVCTICIGKCISPPRLPAWRAAIASRR